MTTTALFEYPCPECGLGTVRTMRILNYKTKIKGFPFVVDEALIGVCDRCQAESFAPEETKRWQELFYHSLEARQAFLSPQEITELRTALGLSMEDFARLIGCTRQSISAWEKRDRTSPPTRMADLIMKLVRRALYAGTVDVLTFLLNEARKWSVVIELRRPPILPAQDGNIVLRTKKVPASVVARKVRSLDLAAQAGEAGKDLVIVETMDGKRVGVLDYDYEQAAITLKDASDLPPWKMLDVEIETHDGQHFTQQDVSVQEHRLVLLKNAPLREKDLVRITLKGQY